MSLLALLAAAWTAAAVADPAGRPVAFHVPLDASPGLYLNGRKTEASEWPRHRAALDRLTERFLSGVRPLFYLGPGETILFGTDDLAYHRARDGASFVAMTEAQRKALGAYISVPKPHEGLDVGARVTADGGKSIRFLGAAPVYPIFEGGRVDVNNGDFLSQRLKFEEGGYVLLLRIVYGHASPLKRKAGAADSPIGVLYGDDRWDALARELESLGSRKGNHAHVLIEGVNDLELPHYVERARSSPADAPLLDYVRYRADFYNERLLPRLRGGR